MKVRPGRPPTASDLAYDFPCRHLAANLEVGAVLHVEVLALRAVCVPEHHVVARTIRLEVVSQHRPGRRSADFGSCGSGDVDAVVMVRPACDRMYASSHVRPDLTGDRESRPLT